MEDEITAENELSSELTGLNKGEHAKKKKLMIGIGIGATILIILIIIIAIIVSSGGSNKETDYSKLEILGQINCTYDIDFTTKPTQILGEEFVKNGDFAIKINDQFIKYVKEYTFSSTGKNEVQFLLYKEISLDKMFSNLTKLISVDLFSEKNLKITSMISVFEGCKNLEYITMKGFDTSQVKSMSKLFSDSYLNKIDFTKVEFDTSNVEDFSYFLSGSRINSFDSKNFNTEKATNMAYMFDNCFSLGYIDVSNFNTSNVKDMSYMFSKLESITSLDLSNFKTNSVINMKAMFQEDISLQTL